MHGWPHTWSVYARGYKAAADRLMLSIETGGGMIDFLVYPILHLYRHFLEVSIKADIKQAQRLLGIETRQTPKRNDKKEMVEAVQGHDLEALWAYLIELASQLHDEIALNPAVIETRTVIAAFHRHDMRGDATRYPQALDGSHSLPKIHEINLRKLREDMQKAESGFGQIEGALDYEESLRKG